MQGKVHACACTHTQVRSCASDKHRDVHAPRPLFFFGGGFQNLLVSGLGEEDLTPLWGVDHPLCIQIEYEEDEEVDKFARSPSHDQAEVLCRRFTPILSPFSTPYILHPFIGMHWP